MKRNVYLDILPVDAAITKICQHLDRERLITTEIVAAATAVGRVLAAPVYAQYSSPTMHAAAMDGYAVRATDTFAAHTGAPTILRSGEQCFAVNTGNPLPEGCDAVIMIEHVVVQPDASISIETPVFPWQNVRRIGEDIVATELLFPQNHKLTAYDVGALLSGGIWEVQVWERLRLRIIPTGDEVLDFTTRPVPQQGQVIESNSQVLCSLATPLGCFVERVPPVPDVPGLLHDALRASLDAGVHVTIFCAGSSAGSKDYTRSVIEQEGTILVHGIAAMPGKPSLAGVCRDKLVIGAPGYPVSNVVCFEELIRPVLCWLMRIPVEEKPVLPVELMRSLPSRLGHEEFVRLSVGRVGQKAVGIPLGRGAGNITTLTRAQAVMRIPANCEGITEGTTVDASLLVPVQQLDAMLICVGSHDNILDVVTDALMGLTQPYHFVSTHVGSMGGISALKNGSCHLAGMHLLDTATGDFNSAFLQKYLPEMDVVLLNLAIRHQGIIVPKGNPKGISGVEDLRGKRLRFINRQRGAGTRILFDWHLQKAQMLPSDVAGYEKEETTHMAVAVNVLTNAADCGMGIYAAAHALDLDFVPLARERYDLAIPKVFWDDPRICALRTLLQDPAFHARINALGGYETTLTGQIMRAGVGLGEG